MGKLAGACITRATECALAARAAGRRGDDTLKTIYLGLAHQWLDIAKIGEEADRERELRDLVEKLDMLIF
jgi:hypothetical protein